MTSLGDHLVQVRHRGVAVDTLLQDVEASAAIVLARGDGGYTTNLPLEDLTDGRAWIVDTYAGEPLAPEHGWCLCASRWEQAHRAGVAPPVLLAATHARSLEWIDLADLQRVAVT